MSFQLSTKPKDIRWKIEGKEPDEKNPGQFKKFFFYATLRRLSQKEFAKIRSEAEDDVVVLRQIMSAWELKDDAGAVFDFTNDDVVREVLSVPYVSLAIFTSYVSMITGGATSKN